MKYYVYKIMKIKEMKGDFTLKMFVSERRGKIMDLLHAKKRVTVNELAANVDVSQATLRSDLNQMESEGLLTRTHGGAVLNDYINNETSFFAREKRNKKEKSSIAEKALEFIEEKQCILLDASSTALELAHLLKEQHLRLTVVTSGVQTALELKDSPFITVILVGGVVTEESTSIEGTLGLGVLDQVNIDIMFTSASGFSIEKGLTDFNIYEVQLKKEMVKRSKKVIALIDHTKIGENSSSVFASSEEISALITDQPISNDVLQGIVDTKMNILVSSR